MRIKYLFFIILLFCTLLHSQNNKLIYSNHYTIADGLSHTGISCVLEDSHGYVWVGTFDGLNRYDGYNFKAYKNTIHNKPLVNNRIYDLFEDSLGNIWICTQNGISIYDYNLQCFKTIYPHNKLLKGDVGLKILKVAEDKQSKSIICTTKQSGLLQFNYSYALINKFYPSRFTKNKSISINDIQILPNSNYILSTSRGLLNFNLSKREFSKVSVRWKNTSCFIKRINDTTLFTNINKGIQYFSYQIKADSVVYKFNGNKLSDYNIVNAALSKSGQLWLATHNNGLLRINNVNNFINDKPYEKAWFKGRDGLINISCIAVARRSGCWVGTIFDEGLYQFQEKKNVFNHCSAKQHLKYGLSSDNIMNLAVLDSDRVFVSTMNKGVVLFNTLTEKFESIKFLRNVDDVKSIFVDESKNIWLQIGFKGLFVIRNNTRKLQPVLYNKKHIFSDCIIRSLVEDEKGNIWLGGRFGVWKLNLDKNLKVTDMRSLNENPFFKNRALKEIRSIYIDPVYPFVWIASEQAGLYRVNIASYKAISKCEVTQCNEDYTDSNSISSNFITDIIRIPNGQLWLSTNSGGICEVLNSDTKPVFKVYSEKDGLSNHVVTGLSYDSDNNLWLSTNRGINKFNTKNKRFLVFTKDDGIPFDTYKYGSAKLDNGYIAFWGYNGVCYFKPEQIREKEPLPNLEISSLKIYNKKVLPKDSINNHVILSKNINYTKQIALKYNENSIALEITSLHYSNAKNNFIEYQLLPVDAQWIKVPSNQRVVQYSALSPGKYIFRMRASNSLNEWTQIKKISIIIKPPFWHTTWAFIAYMLLLILIVYVLLVFRLRVQALKHNLQIDQLEIDNVKEVNAAKLRFFSNISHEIKTPLTLIAGPVETLVCKYKNNTEISEKLAIVQRQSKKITQLVDQVHDFQRSDVNQLKVNNSTFNFNSFVKDLCVDFKYLADTTSKIFEIQSCSKDVYVCADRDKVEKILNNLLNNAFKYTKANDTIMLAYEQRGDLLIFSVSDTGKGIDSEDLPFIFNRFYQSKQEHSAYTGGSGIGLAFSKRLVELHKGKISAKSVFGEGATLSVELPLVVELSDVDISDKEQEVLQAGKLELIDVKKAEKTVLKTDADYSKTKIYLVEDNNDMRLFISEILTDFFEVTTFTNGQECVDKMQDVWPDLIVSDVLMPELNGFDLCRIVKADIKTSHIPIVLLTACTSIDEQIQGVNEGADAYITKPFNVQYLISRVELLLKNRQQLRERFQMSLPLTLNREHNQNDHIFLEKLYAVINENIDNQDLDVDYLARTLYFNRTKFYQKVKSVTNSTPFEFLKDYRLTKAAELLVQKNASVGDVIEMTGFKSRTHFNKVFKERYKSTPSKYAAEQRAKL